MRIITVMILKGNTQTSQETLAGFSYFLDPFAYFHEKNISPVGALFAACSLDNTGCRSGSAGSQFVLAHVKEENLGNLVEGGKKGLETENHQLHFRQFFTKQSDLQVFPLHGVKQVSLSIDFAGKDFMRIMHAFAC